MQHACFYEKTLSKLLQRALTGFAAGGKAMVAASIWSLLIPASKQSGNMELYRLFRQFSEILRHAHIPYQKATDMQTWQLCHPAMVVIRLQMRIMNQIDPEKVEKNGKL